MGEITRQPVFFVREKGGREGEGEEGVALKYTSYSHRSFFTRRGISYISYVSPTQNEFRVFTSTTTIIKLPKRSIGKK